MSCDIRDVKDLPSFINYLKSELNWGIDVEDFDEVDDYTFEWTAEDLDIQEDVFAKIVSLKQLRPSSDDDKWGIFCVEFDSPRFEVSVLRKILSGLIPNQRQTSDRAVWQQRDLLFICFWGEGNNNTIGVAHFEDKEQGLPQIKMIYCSPALEENNIIKVFENRLAKLKWPEDPSDTEKWRDEWSAAFTVGYKETIRTSAALTVKLAEAALNIKNRVLEVLKIESEKGYVHSLYNKFKELLIHDMDEKQFADMYAQTVVYGLFSARCMDKTQDDFSSEEAVECIPNTNPFLKNLMKECFAVQSSSKISFDELEIGNVVDLLLHTRTDTIVEDFGKKTGNEDPIIHFYESFLEVYDKNQKVQRGVFYTPQPVVSFIVRAVDDIIKSEFGIKDGLASTETKKIKYMRKSKKLSDGQYGKVYKDVEDTKEIPAVQILDPATGTGTFLRQTILNIYDTFKNNYKDRSEEELKLLWNDYVPNHLLPRLNGYELMMAPYAVAHMKLAMVLKETGYEFNSDKRLNIFLTNTLEPSDDSDTQISLWADPLAMESVEANKSKNDRGATVIIGNPPYSGESATKNHWIAQLMEKYKREPGGIEKLKERNPKWLNDDYVKFIRYAQYLLEEKEKGILSFICPHGFLDNPTFRGMRWELLHEFNKIYVLDLHGNAKKLEVCPNGDKDENVFDIQQGVCIIIAVKNTTNFKNAKVYHADLYGNRDFKYEFLSHTALGDIVFNDVSFVEPYFFFIHKDLQDDNEYVSSSFFGIDDMFIKNSVGFVSARDSLCIQNSYDDLMDIVDDFSSLVVEEAREKYKLKKDVRDWKVAWAQKDINEKRNIDKSINTDFIKEVAYRPFDNRYTYYTGVSRGFQCYPRYEVLSNMIHCDNLALCTTKVMKAGKEWHHVFVSNMPVDSCFVSNKTSEITYVYPLYLVNDNEIYPNLKFEIVNKFSEMTGMKYIPLGDVNELSAKSIFYYIYAILSSSLYRRNYNEYLKIGFPRVPYTSDNGNFGLLVNYGKKLVDLHVEKSDIEVINTFYGKDLLINKIVYDGEKIYINDSSYFVMPKEIWDYEIGCYKVIQKWLKDRKNTVLSNDNLMRFEKIVSIIKETILIVDKIDCLIKL